MKSQAPTAAQKRYWSLITSFGCCVCGGPAEVAHAHGPSVSARGFVKPHGKKFRWQHWLVLPLCPLHHRMATMSFDNAMRTWEENHGTAAMHLDMLIARTGIDVWALARALLKDAHLSAPV